jgi:hypothetical protein
MHPDHQGGRSPSGATCQYQQSAAVLSLEVAGALFAAAPAGPEAVVVEAFLGSAPVAVVAGTYSHRQLPGDYFVPVVLLKLVH